MAATASESVSDREWLAQQFDALTTELEVLTPSACAESMRYLPPSATSMPGMYRFAIAPYLREILDCLGVESPVREVAFMKGVQVCATVGVLENAILYYIAFVKTAPMMFVTATLSMAKTRMDAYVMPMLQHSGLTDLIKSGDETNSRKTGNTTKKLDWVGGGFLLPFGSKEAAGLRSFSIRILVNDEIDGWPVLVGQDGCPRKLAVDRTAAYESSRKILDISTPLIKGTSKIDKQFRLGDQRYYHVNCLGCGHAQVLRWRRVGEHGEVSGIVWDTDPVTKNLVPGSVRYLCEKCFHPHTNDDKTRLLAPENGAQWIPTAIPSSPERRSYHLSALYSPVGMQTWEACVRKWLDAWDVEHNRPRDMGSLQVFYNNVLGEPFEAMGQKVTFEIVSSHRRIGHYNTGELPNVFAERYCGSPILVLVCTVDVHADNLAVAVWGWARDRRAFLVSYTRLHGDTDRLDNPETWGALRTIIEGNEYTADDGKLYRIQLTTIDSGYKSETVYSFCAEYAYGVFPVKGQHVSPKTAKFKEFSAFTTPLGKQAFGITVDIYKDRWSTALRRSWDGQSLQPVGFFNAPADISDRELKELTVEVRREKRDAKSNAVIGYEWFRPNGVDNELWDLLIYANAALEILAWSMCEQAGAEELNWIDFYDALSRGAFFTQPIEA